MKNNEGELDKSNSHIIVEIIEYIPNAVVSKTIIKKITGNITVSSFDTGEVLAEKMSPFDTYIQIIDGTANLTINKNEYDVVILDEANVAVKLGLIRVQELVSLIIRHSINTGEHIS